MKEIKTRHIQKAVLSYFNHHYQLLNSYVFDWESDYFGMTSSSYFYEVEVKISRADFKADFKKRTKHQKLANSHKDLIVLRGETTKENFGTRWDPDIRELSRISIVKNTLIPHRFFYAAPKGLLSVDEIPKYAGLIEVFFKHGQLQVDYAKKAPFLHKADIKNRVKDILLEKFYYKMQEYRSCALRLQHQVENMEEKYLLSGSDETEINKMKIMFNH